MYNKQDNACRYQYSKPIQSFVYYPFLNKNVYLTKIHGFMPVLNFVLAIISASVRL